MFNLINNKLNIFIDPCLFSHKKKVEEQVLLVSTLKEYLKKIEPNLCDIIFFFPKYLEDNLNTSRVFFDDDPVEFLLVGPKNKIESIIIIPTEIQEKNPGINMLNNVYTESISLAIENKCPFFLTDLVLGEDKKKELKKKYNIEFINISDLFKKIEQFLQGFYNYFKYYPHIYGIDSPDVSHQMTNIFFEKKLVPWEAKINKNILSEDTKERIRSFVHNRYIDILVSVDQISFFKLQQIIDDTNRGLLDNVNPRFHGSVRYHLNYYIYLLCGAIDHLGVILNDILIVGYSPEKQGLKINLRKNKDDKKNEFLNKIKLLDEVFYRFVTSDDIQEWFDILFQIRNKSSHREMFSASPIAIETIESTISDSEIDKIIYKNNPPIPNEYEHLFTKDFIENQKIIDRINYRISKMSKGIEHAAFVKSRDGKLLTIDPILRIPFDLKKLEELINNIIESQNRFLSKAVSNLK